MVAKLCLLCAGLLMGTVVVEVILRVVGISYPTLYTNDPDLASRHLPGASGYWLTEGRAFVRINSDGLRDREHSVSAPSNTLRIALLGDSYCEAFQVDVEETFWWIAQQRMEDCGALGSRRVEICNFGVATYSTAQEFLLLQRDVVRYKPDVVLLAFTPQNDLWENAKSLSGLTTGQHRAIKPFFEIHDGQLVLDRSFRDSPVYLARSSTYECIKALVVNASYTLQLLKHFKQHGLSTGKTVKVTVHGEAVLAEAARHAAVFSAPKTTDWKKAWLVTDRLLLEVRDEARRQQAEFKVLVLSTCLQSFPDANVRERFQSEHGIEDLFYTNHRICELGLCEGFAVFDLGPKMQRHADEQGVVLHGFDNTPHGVGHYNAAGHRIVGKLMADWLCQEFEKAVGDDTR